MGLGKLFGRHEVREEVQPEMANLNSCPHTTMTPRWDSAEDIGHHDRATGFRCEGCGRMFSAEEAAQLRESESDRLQSALR